MKRAFCGFLCVLVLTLMGTAAWGQVRAMVGPGALSAVSGGFASVEWRLAAEVEFFRSVGARLWLQFGDDLGWGWGLGPLLRFGQFSLTLGLQSLYDVFFLIGRAGIEFGLGRAGALRFQFFNDVEFALSLSEGDAPSLIQYHVGLSVGL